MTERRAAHKLLTMAPRSRKSAPPAKVKRKPGRPVYWTVARKKAAFRLICAEVSGGRTIPAALNVLGLRDPERRLPSFTMMYNWMAKDQPAASDLSEALACAKDVRAQMWSEDLIEIASDGTNDTYIDGQGNVRTDYDVLGRSKLRIETIEKVLARQDPKRFGHKLDLTSDGKALPAPVASPYVLFPATLPPGAPIANPDPSPAQASTPARP